jgi:hypothetical protein
VGGIARPEDSRIRHPVTPDGRYFVVRGRLWRCADPSLPEPERARLVGALMAARRGVATARRAGDAAALAAARAAVDVAKRALGERGPVWWTDGAPDLNRRMARNTPYAAWHAAVTEAAAADAAPSTERR